MDEAQALRLASLLPEKLLYGYSVVLMTRLGLCFKQQAPNDEGAVPPPPWRSAKDSTIRFSPHPAGVKPLITPMTSPSDGDYTTRRRNRQDSLGRCFVKAKPPQFKEGNDRQLEF
jgi:hypothetical protein